MESHVELPTETVQKLISSAFSKAFKLKKKDVKSVTVKFYVRRGYSEEFVAISPDELRVSIVAETSSAL